MKKLDTLSRSCLALAVSQALVASAGAANIEVTNDADTTIPTPGNCTLRDAVLSANTDTSVGGCASGAGTDTITFSNSVIAGGTVSLTQASSILIESNLDVNGPASGTMEINGMDNAGVLSIDGSYYRVSLNNLTISDGLGGIVVGGEGVSVTLSNSNISGNNGRGLVDTSDTYFTTSRITLIDSTVSNNTAAARGGGIFSNSGAVVALTRSTVSGNISDSDGGGIFVENGSLNLTDSTVSGNTAFGVGGGIRSYDDDPNFTFSVRISNSAISGNSAGDAGGLVATGSSLSINNSTISNNVATNMGGGIVVLGSIVNITNSIIAGNTASTVFEILDFFLASTFTIDNNLFGDSSNTTAGAFVFGAPVGSNIFATSDGAQPTALSSILGPLADNGGPTLTHALVANSPAINAALDTLCPSADQRGEQRDNRCDIGSFEFIEDGDSNDESCFIVKAANGNVMTFCL